MGDGCEWAVQLGYGFRKRVVDPTQELVLHSNVEQMGPRTKTAVCWMCRGCSAYVRGELYRKKHVKLLIKQFSVGLQVNIYIQFEMFK